MVSNLKCRCHGVLTGDRHDVLLTLLLLDFWAGRDRFDLVRVRGRVVAFCDTFCDVLSVSLSLLDFADLVLSHSTLSPET
jgi:hypothetical protein